MAERDFHLPDDRQPWNVSRRRALWLLGAATGGLLTTSFASTFDGLPAENPPFLKPQKTGWTLSQLQCERYLGQDYFETLDAALSLYLDFGRLCIYWNESEIREGIYDFSKIRGALDKVVRHNLQREKLELPPFKVILAQGPLFSPRIPESHPPGDLLPIIQALARDGLPIDDNSEVRDRALAFHEAATLATLDYPIIRQLENEAQVGLPSADNMFASDTYLKELIDKTHMLSPNSKIAMTTPLYLFAKNDKDGVAFQKILRWPVDIVGVNFYTSVPLHDVPFGDLLASRGIQFFHQPGFGFWSRANSWLNQIIAAGKEPWAAEIQAEPWGGVKVPVYTDSPEHVTATPKRAQDLTSTLAAQGWERAGFWGVELAYYWLKRGYAKWWDMYRQYSKI